MRRPILILGALLVGAVGLWVWAEFRPVPDLEIMGEEQSPTLAYIGLATGAVGMLTALFNMVQAAIELRGKRRSP